MRPQSLALILALMVSACAGRATVATSAVAVQITLRIRNNLNTPLTLRASHAEAVIWNGSVAANGTHEAAVGPLPVGTLISLRATTAQGSVVSLRDSIPVRAGVVIWTIP